MISAQQKKIGLSEKYLEQMTAIFQKNPSLQKVILFGSRAKGTQKPMSDIDLALLFSDQNIDNTSHIHYQLEEETTIPYFFDVLNVTSISSDELREHIREYGIVFYEKKDRR